MHSPLAGQPVSLNLQSHCNILKPSGWLTSFARIFTSAGVAYIAATTTQGLIILNYPLYIQQRWHATLLYWAVLFLSTLVNILGVHVFPYIEIVALILYVFYFFALLVPLVYLSPQSSTAFVFQTIENSGGWTNTGVSWCIGLVTCAYALTGRTHQAPFERQIADGNFRYRLCCPYESVNQALQTAHRQVTNITL